MLDIYQAQHPDHFCQIKLHILLSKGQDVKDDEHKESPKVGAKAPAVEDGDL